MIVREKNAPHADRRARGRCARRALRVQPGADVDGRQRLPRPRAERAARAWRPRSSTSARAATPCCTPVRSTGTPPASRAGQPRRIEQALKSGDPVLVQVTKDPIGHKGARLTSQVTLAGRYLVYVPGGGMTGISRKLPDTERNRLKKHPARDRPGLRGRHRAHRRRGRQRGRAARRHRPPAGPVGGDREEVEDRVGPGAAAGRAGHGDPRGPRHLQRRLLARSSSRATRPGRRSRRTSTSSPRTWRRRSSPLDVATRTCSPCTASTSSWPRAWTARSGCRRAARWSSTAPRP